MVQPEELSAPPLSSIFKPFIYFKAVGSRKSELTLETRKT